MLAVSLTQKQRDINLACSIIFHGIFSHNTSSARTPASSGTTSEFFFFHVSLRKLYSRSRLLFHNFSFIIPSQLNSICLNFKNWQILLDVVALYNMVTSLSQQRQSIKLTHEGIEVSRQDPLIYLLYLNEILILIRISSLPFATCIQVFREYYPINQDYVTLECVWETDKFVLMERTHKGKIEGEVQELDKNDSIDEVRVQYESIEALLGGGPFASSFNLILISVANLMFYAGSVFFVVILHLKMV